MKPNIFIGSATEELTISYAIQQELEDVAECVVWNQNVICPGKSIFESLIEAAEKCEYSIFVFAPSDNIIIKGVDKKSVRDNIILELGLFIGKIGAENCFMIVPKDYIGLHLPTDLSGIAYLSYSSKRVDENYRAAVGPACNQIRIKIKKDKADQEKNISTCHLDKAISNFEALPLCKEVLPKKTFATYLY